MSRFEIKIVAALLLIAVIPLAASVFLVDQVLRVSNSVAEGQVRRLSRSLDRSAQAYRDLFAARKRVFTLQGEALVRDPLLLQLVECADRSEAAGGGASRAAGCAEDPLLRRTLVERLEHFTEREPELGLVEVLGPGGSSLARSRRVEGFDPGRYRDLRLSLALGRRGHKLRMVFFTPRAPFDEDENNRFAGIQQPSAQFKLRFRQVEIGKSLDFPLDPPADDPQ